jgi:hypothetical protein
MKLSHHAGAIARISILGLAACAAPAPQWEKPGASDAALKEDSEQCRVEARLSPHAAAPSASVAGMAPEVAGLATSREEERAPHDTGRFQECMRGKGYSVKR